VAEPLKNSYGPEVPARIGAMIVAVEPDFPVDAFLAHALDGFEALELTPRARHVARALALHLPEDYERAVDILVRSLGPTIEGDELTGMDGFLYLPYVFFVADRGLEHWEASMRAQYELTQRFTAEYSIRAFIDHEPERTHARLREWTADPSPHVRRLVSEGTRPRLPWAPRLQRFVLDPAPVLELLELLKDDPALYVRRSVANNLNDIGKDHPDVLVETCAAWEVDAGDERRWVIRHALRSAVKRGDVGALAVLGFSEPNAAELTSFDIAPSRPGIGDSLRVAFDLRNAGSRRARFNVDLRVHFAKASGRTSPRMFKVREVELEAGESVTLSKSISLQQRTTRTHYPGDHAVEVVVNGASTPAGSFRIV
jgi:3-methyladenine DNA glycosylase AlkC